MWCPEVIVSRFGNREVKLVCNMRTWYTFETASGISLALVGSSPRTMRTLLWALLHQFQPDITEIDLGRLPLSQFDKLMRAGAAVLSSSLRVATPSEEASGVAVEPARLVDWDELQAFAWIDLGRISEEQFWEMSPAFLYHLVARYEAQVERHFMASSVVAAAITNVHLDHEKHPEPLDPLVFSPTKLGAKARIKADGGEQQDLSKKILQIFGSVPGAIKTHV